MIPPPRWRYQSLPVDGHRAFVIQGETDAQNSGDTTIMGDYRVQSGLQSASVGASVGYTGLARPSCLLLPKTDTPTPETRNRAGGGERDGRAPSARGCARTCDRPSPEPRPLSPQSGLLLNHISVYPLSSGRVPLPPDIQGNSVGIPQ